MQILKAISRWGGLLGAFGGLIWAVLFFIEATRPGFDLRNQLQHQPAFGLIMVLGISFQAAGFYSLSVVPQESSAPRISAKVCAAGAFAQAAALLAVSIFGLGVAWLLGIVGELAIPIALSAFAISSLTTKLPLIVKLIPILMVPFYFFGWAVDPGSISVAQRYLVNLSAAFYYLLWIPFGYAIWSDLRDRNGGERSVVT
jgi:hypothetical protein